MQLSLGGLVLVCAQDPEPAPRTQDSDHFLPSIPASSIPSDEVSGRIEVSGGLPTCLSGG